MYITKRPSKVILTLALVSSLISATISAEITNAPPKQDQVAQGVLILVIVGIASCFVIKAYKEKPDLTEHVLVLQRDYYDDNWINLATNYHAVLYTKKPITIFSDTTKDSAARYRVLDITPK